MLDSNQRSLLLGKRLAIVRTRPLCECVFLYIIKHYSLNHFMERWIVLTLSRKIIFTMITFESYQDSDVASFVYLRHNRASSLCASSALRTMVSSPILSLSLVFFQNLSSVGERRCAGVPGILSSLPLTRSNSSNPNV